MKPRTETKYVVRIECLVSEFKIGENGSSLAHHLRFLGIVNNRVQIMKTDDFQCAVRIHVLLIWNNPLRGIQNNVLAPLTKLSSLTIHPVDIPLNIFKVAMI
jgi:hypothetical protein